MEQYNVKLLRRAVQDLDDIYSYIAQSLLELETASRLLGRLENAIFSLEALPYRCPERRVGTYANQGYRQLFWKVTRSFSALKNPKSRSSSLVCALPFVNNGFD